MYESSEIEVINEEKEESKEKLRAADNIYINYGNKTIEPRINHPSFSSSESSWEDREAQIIHSPNKIKIIEDLTWGKHQKLSLKRQVKLQGIRSGYGLFFNYTIKRRQGHFCLEKDASVAK